MPQFKFSLSVAVLVALFSSSTAFAAGWGDVQGQVKVVGDVPAPVKIDTAGKDPAVCAANKPIMSDDLIVDANTKGLKNCIIYLKSSPSSIHPDAAKAAAGTKIKFDNDNCVFEPHCIVVQTSQVVNGVNSDGCSHNIKTAPFNNQGENPILQPNDKTGYDFKFSKSEKVPFPVECNIHSWMKAYWMVVDNPYATVTDSEGKFSIPKLPEGEHTFIVWHERAGFLERSLKVKVMDGKVSEVSVNAPAEKLKK